MCGPLLRPRLAPYAPWVRATGGSIQCCSIVGALSGQGRKVLRSVMITLFARLVSPRKEAFSARSKQFCFGHGNSPVSLARSTGFGGGSLPSYVDAPPP